MLFRSPTDWVEPSLPLNQKIIDSLKQIQRKGQRPIPLPTIHQAPVWTTPAPFRETKAEVSEYAKRGMAAVEMETASLFAAAQFLGLASSAVLVISDSFATGTHQLPPKPSRIDDQILAITKNLVHLFNV